jgi:histone demethylase JARID1
VETQRFYLRKLEGAEVLLSYETNFFRQELHKWCPVASEAPPILEVSLSTRKPRPTKLQKMLAEYGVENPDDLPEHAKGKANSLRRKAANAEAAAAAAHNSGGSLIPSGSSGAYGGPAFYMGSSDAADATTPPHSLADDGRRSSTERQTKSDPMDVDSGLHPGLLGSGGPMFVDNSAMSLEERLLHGQDEDVDLNTEAAKSKALEILGRTEVGRRQAEQIWGPNVWDSRRGSMGDADRSITPGEVDAASKEDEGNVDQMFKEMTNQEDDEDNKKKDDNNNTAETAVTAESLESERNGLDAMIDGE